MKVSGCDLILAILISLFRVWKITLSMLWLVLIAMLYDFIYIVFQKRKAAPNTSNDTLQQSLTQGQMSGVPIAKKDRRLITSRFNPNKNRELQKLPLLKGNQLSIAIASDWHCSIKLNYMSANHANSGVCLEIFFVQYFCFSSINHVN